MIHPSSPRYPLQHPTIRLEEDKKYHPIYKRIFHDHRRLTEHAMQACKELMINPEDLIDRSMDDFARDTSNGFVQKSMKGELPKEVVEIRYNHHQNKRKILFEQIAKTLGVFELTQVHFQRQHTKKGPTLRQESTRSAIFKPFSLKPGGIQSTRALSPANNRNMLGAQNNTQHLPTINSRANMIDDNHHETQSNYQGNGSQLKKVGKVQFGTVMTPQNATKGNNNSMFRSMISSPESYNKVNHQLQQLQARMNKEQTRVERFKNVRQNQMLQAEQTVQRFQQKILNGMKMQEKFKEHLSQQQEIDQHRFEKYKAKMQNAKKSFAETLTKLDRRSFSGYNLKLKEVQEINNKRVQKDRQHSQRHFESLKHKIEEEENLYKKRSEIRRKEDEEANFFLTAFERKMSRGLSNAEHYKRETSSKASRISVLQEDAQRQYHSICESEHTRSLDKVIKKDSTITQKIQRKSEQYSRMSNEIRDQLSHRFERNHSARSTVSEQQKKRNKLTLDRMNQKERLKQILIERQQLEVLKNREINSLKKADHSQSLQKQQAIYQQLKERVVKKIQIHDSQRKDIKLNLEMLQTQAPSKNHVQLAIEERQVIQQLNPRDILAQARLNLTLQYSGQATPQKKGNRKFNLTQRNNTLQMTR